VSSGDGVEDAAESAEDLFLAQLDTIERAIGYACRHGSMRDEDAEDFASWVKLKLIEKNYAVIRKYERRASFAGFISVVVQRLLLDYRISQWGKWHASAEAKRLGEPAITIEAMLYRDGRTIDDVLPMLMRRWPDLGRETVEAIARRLPSRAPRPRSVDLELVKDTLTALDSADEFETERVDLARRIEMVVRETMSGLERQRRLIFRLRFDGGMSVAEISRVLRIEQKPLYRSLQRTLALLRKRLENAGVNAEDVQDILESRRADLDFGFTESTRPDGPAMGEEGT